MHRFFLGGGITKANLFSKSLYQTKQTPVVSFFVTSPHPPQSDKANSTVQLEFDLRFPEPGSVQWHSTYEAKKEEGAGGGEGDLLNVQGAK